MIQIGNAKIYTGDVIECLKKMPDKSVHCCITSPPYWGLRDYKADKWEGGNPDCDHIQSMKTSLKSGLRNDGRLHKGLYEGEKELISKTKQYKDICKNCGAVRTGHMIGLEKTFQEWLDKMVAVSAELWRVLRDDGTYWLNCGDSYASSWASCRRSKIGNPSRTERFISTGNGLKEKDLIMMPARLAIALQEAGWYVRSEIIWAKPNPMPESVTDRPTSSHEKIYLLTKKPRYFYDADAVREITGNESNYDNYGGKSWHPHEEDLTAGNVKSGTGKTHPSGRNQRNVWHMATHPYPDAHFATFPPELPRRCILAGTSEKGCCSECGNQWERVTEISRTFESGSGKSGNMPVGKHGSDLQGGGETLDIRRGPVIHSITTGWKPTCDHDHDPIPSTVLDIFAGSGTTLEVALSLNRKAIGIELNPDYVELMKSRIMKEATQEKLPL